MDDETKRQIEGLEKVILSTLDMIERLKAENLVLASTLGHLTGRVAATMNPPLEVWAQIGELIRMAGVTVSQGEPGSPASVGGGKMADLLLSRADAAFEAHLGSKIERGEI